MNGMETYLSLHKKLLDTYLLSQISQNKKISSHRLAHLNQLQKILGMGFKNISLLNKALTHPSYANDRSTKGQHFPNNQRLEFFGDAILNVIVSEYLFLHHRDFKEGKLSKIRSIAVSHRVLVKVAKSLNLGEFLLLGKGEKNAGTQNVSSVLEDTVEAIIAAIYIDGGINQVRKFIMHHFKDEIEQIVVRLDELNYKSMLQEFIQRDYKSVPVYKLDKTEGPGHKIYFYVSVYLNDKLLGQGAGYSKKDAEAICAKNALERNYRKSIVKN